MYRHEFAFDLPTDLIAQAPLPVRSASRLLVLAGAAEAPLDQHFVDLPEWLREGDLLVFNDTRVLPARLYGTRIPGGGRVELLLEQIHDAIYAQFQIASNRRLRVGQRLRLAPEVEAQVEAVHRGGFYDLLLVGAQAWEQVCATWGQVPLPPYIRRPVAAADAERYQTVFARRPGAVAAPTAALHFDAELVARLQARGVGMAFITLHVGAGTFLPMRVQEVAQHALHAERAEVSEVTCARIQEAWQAGGRVIAVGTTVVRALEAAAPAAGRIEPLRGPIANFIYPGYSFNIVRNLITNFHLPESTLLMLVCALGGTARVLRAYRHAVEARYRFFSYGDAMMLLET